MLLHSCRSHVARGDLFGRWILRAVFFDPECQTGDSKKIVITGNTPNIVLRCCERFSHRRRYVKQAVSLCKWRFSLTWDHLWPIIGHPLNLLIPCLPEFNVSTLIVWGISEPLFCVAIFLCRSNISITQDNQRECGKSSTPLSPKIAAKATTN